MAEIKICFARDLKYWSRGSFRPDVRFRPFAVAYVGTNEMLSTEIDEKGDRCPKWDATGSFSSVGPINDDTTLSVAIFDARKDGTNRKIGSASLNLKKVVNDFGYGQRAKQTLQLERISGRSRGAVNVEVLITEPVTAQPDGRPPKKTKKIKELFKGLIRGLTVANVLSDVVEALDGIPV